MKTAEKIGRSSMQCGRVLIRSSILKRQAFVDRGRGWVDPYRPQASHDAGKKMKE